ncbi:MULTISPECIES: hypothetical protein [unclassified Rhizobium]|uniref:hypothetical protein n=1 Tax=unclassified Rhizobium TaxID=2613769 RepID=UPI001046E3E7|nr:MULTISPECIES: hypothetical protein [unclassified Rhizobium]MBB3397924.1 hypothetical protein [Rhizobium sp. BK060]
MRWWRGSHRHRNRERPRQAPPAVLVDREWAEITGEGLRLSQPDELLDAWRDAHEAPSGERLAFYALKTSLTKDLNSPLVDLLAGMLKRGVESGEFRKGVDPVHLDISIAALSYFYLSNNHTLSAIFGRDLLSPAALEERPEHIQGLVPGYVTAT